MMKVFSKNINGRPHLSIQNSRLISYFIRNGEETEYISKSNVKAVGFKIKNDKNNIRNRFSEV